MTEREIAGIFKEHGALLEGHFVLSSGLHSRKYLQCALVLAHPAVAEKLGRAIAARFKGARIDVVASPAIGGIVIGHEIARALGVPAVFAERQDGKMTLRRGFRIAGGQSVLVVEDVTTTGGSAAEVISLVRECGAKAAGVGAIVDRSGGKVNFGVRYEPLVRWEVESYEPSECPLCREGITVVKPGSRK